MIFSWMSTLLNYHSISYRDSTNCMELINSGCMNSPSIVARMASFFSETKVPLYKGWWSMEGFLFNQEQNYNHKIQNGSKATTQTQSNSKSPTNFNQFKVQNNHKRDETDTCVFYGWDREEVTRSAGEGLKFNQTSLA